MSGRKFYRVLGRNPVPYDIDSPDYAPAVFQNIHPFFGHPLAEGLASFADMRRRMPDGQPFLDLDDFATMNEILIIRAVNEKRARRKAQQKYNSRASMRH